MAEFRPGRRRGPCRRRRGKAQREPEEVLGLALVDISEVLCNSSV